MSFAKVQPDPVVDTSLVIGIKIVASCIQALITGKFFQNTVMLPGDMDRLCQHLFDTALQSPFRFSPI